MVSISTTTYVITGIAATLGAGMGYLLAKNAEVGRYDDNLVKKTAKIAGFVLAGAALVGSGVFALCFLAQVKGTAHVLILISAGIISGAIRAHNS